MDWIARAFDEFGRGMGMAGLALPQSGSLDLTMSDHDTISFERGPDDVIACIKALLPAVRLEHLEKALTLCHYHNQAELPLQIGLWNDDILIIVRIRNALVSVYTLHQAYNKLLGLNSDLHAL